MQCQEHAEVCGKAGNVYLTNIGLPDFFYLFIDLDLDIITLSLPPSHLSAQCVSKMLAHCRCLQEQV